MSTNHEDAILFNAEAAEMLKILRRRIGVKLTNVGMHLSEKALRQVRTSASSALKKIGCRPRAAS